MKKFYFYNIFSSFLCVCFSLFCQPEEDASIGELVAPSNLSFTADISTKGDGIVNFVAKADDAIVYHYYFGLGESEKAFLSSDGKATVTYTRPGKRTYDVKVIAYGKGGVKTEKTQQIEVEVISDIPPEIIQYLTGGNKRHWKWKSSVAGHLGLGEQFNNGEKNYIANWYQAGIDEKAGAGCLYEDIMTFTDNQDGTYSYELDNGSGNTFFRQETVYDALGEANPPEDRCYVFDTKGTKAVTFKKEFEPNENSTGIFMNFSDGGFMSFYLGKSEYEILSISPNELRVRVVQDYASADSDGNFTWYHTFDTTTARPNTPSGGGDDNATNCPGNVEDANASGDNDVLVWADEFDGNTLCTENWAFDIGRGSGGWGNNEAQYYTDRTDNVKVEDGVLKITAKKENFSGSAYTSSRIKTETKFDFKYGKVIVRAKLPQGGGTWPAIWMLGANFSSVSWPACGEIDIMEHVGNNPNNIISALHYPGNSGGAAISKSNPISNVSTEFHDYELRWTSEDILFYVDGKQTHSFKNEASVPFNHNFFIILNVALGGTLGGNIDPNFTESTMEIDYVRVYQ